MGVKTVLRPQQGVQKNVFRPPWGGMAPEKVKETLLTLKMINSDLENKHFLNQQQKLA
jgi:hypothetical protein